MRSRGKMAQRIDLPSEKLTNAQSVEGWNMSLFGAPRLTVTCGGCYSQFKTRDYYPFTSKDGKRGSVAYCSRCSKWNIMDVILS